MSASKQSGCKPNPIQFLALSTSADRYRCRKLNGASATEGLDVLLIEGVQQWAWEDPLRNRLGALRVTLCALRAGGPLMTMTDRVGRNGTVFPRHAEPSGPQDDRTFGSMGKNTKLGV